MNTDNRLWHRGAVAAVATLAVAGLMAASAWAAQPSGGKSKDDDTNRAVNRQGPVNRNSGGGNAMGRNIQSGGAGPVTKRVESNTVKQAPTFQGTKSFESKGVAKRNGTAKAGSNQLAEIDKDKMLKGNKEIKGAETKGAGTKGQTINRGRTGDTDRDQGSSTKKVTGGKLPGAGGQKSLDGLNKGGKVDNDLLKKTGKTLPPGMGKKTTIDDVRKHIDGQKNRGMPPGGKGFVDPGKRLPPGKNVFQDRMKAGDFDRVTTGAAAKKLKLAEQYHMYGKGDVARRMALEHHAGHPVMYHGVVSPLYKKHCSPYHYWGPAFFAGMCLYPHWDVWVDWSWHYHCRPYWDPRPYWCRPVIYQPAPVWVYWQTPTWTPLPEATCGTWVDLKPVVIPANDTDLQLVAVRFVDPGHPEEKLGPRYRVWFRNNGSQPITQPFSVMLLAGNDARMVEGMAQAGVQVTSVEPGAIQSVDIRLPADVLALGRGADGKPAPFGMLHVLVDANQEIAETTKENNGVRLAPADVLPVDPAAFEIKPRLARVGEEILLAGEGFGPEPGRVLVQVNGQELDGEILGWYDLGVQWALPKLAVNGPVEADVVVIRGDGAAANPVKVKIMP